MRKSIIKQAKTKDEAIRRALVEIAKERSEVDIEVINEGSSGFLGIGSKDAVVRISYDEDINEALLDIEDEIKRDTLGGSDFDREYNIKDRSSYYKDEASANYKDEGPIVEDDSKKEDYARDGAEFEQSIHNIKDEEENLGNYERLQKINSYEENSKTYKKDTEDLSKILDQRIDSLEKRDINRQSIEPEELKRENNEKDNSVLFTKFEDDSNIKSDKKTESSNLTEKLTFESSDSEVNTDKNLDEINERLSDDFKANNSHDIVYDKQQTDIDKYYKAKEFLEEILRQMHFENASVYGNLEGSIIKLDAKVEEKDTGIAIGKGGATLDAIELIIRKSIDSRANNLRVNVDINNYKKRRDEKIKELARDTAKKVAKSKKAWNLKYMNSYERRLAHEEISKHPNVDSHSEGQEPKRYVVVDYVGEDEK